MDGKFYMEILERHLPEVRNLFQGNWWLQQDNDPKHTSHIAKEFLDNNVPEVMDWPSNSPDLNPIENLWDIVDTQIRKRETQLNNIDELTAIVIQEWNNVSIDTIHNLIESMPWCIRAGIDAKGWHTKY